MKDEDKEEEQRSGLQGTMAMGPRVSTCQRHLELRWNLTQKTVSPLLQFHTWGLSLFGCWRRVNRHSNKVRCLAVWPGIPLRWSQNCMLTDCVMSHCVGSCVKGSFVFSWLSSHLSYRHLYFLVIQGRSVKLKPPQIKIWTNLGKSGALISSWLKWILSQNKRAFVANNCCPSTVYSFPCIEIEKIKLYTECHRQIPTKPEQTTFTWSTQMFSFLTKPGKKPGGNSWTTIVHASIMMQLMELDRWLIHWASHHRAGCLVPGSPTPSIHCPFEHQLDQHELRGICVSAV